MNVIFLTTSRIKDVNARGIYTDLMRKFRDEGHCIYIVTPYERQYGLPTSLKEEEGIHILGVRTLNIQKTNVIEKGIGTILLESQFKAAIKKHLANISFDIILYSTPPITLTNVVNYLKRKNPQSVSYLLLKDIFPQNAVDLRMFSKRNPLYWYFRRKEVELYKCSDYIGCMSPANVEYVLAHNHFIRKERVEVAPNSIELLSDNVAVDRERCRRKYALPIDKTIFIYGGNLGKPQGIDFLIRCMEANKERQGAHFLIVGNGTEYHQLESWYSASGAKNVTIQKSVPKVEYDLLVQSCDVGLIFLDYRFTIPNYPSRLLSYLEYKMPILAATDVNSDIGKIAEKNGYGYWCDSSAVDGFTRCIDQYLKDIESIKMKGEKGYQYLLDNYLVENTYKKIVSHFQN